MALNKNYLVQRLYRYKNRYTIQKDQPKKLRLNIMKNNLKTATEEADIFMDWITYFSRQIHVIEIICSVARIV